MSFGAALIRILNWTYRVKAMYTYIYVCEAIRLGHAHKFKHIHHSNQKYLTCNSIYIKHLYLIHLKKKRRKSFQLFLAPFFTHSLFPLIHFKHSHIFDTHFLCFLFFIFSVFVFMPFLCSIVVVVLNPKAQI